MQDRPDRVCRRCYGGSIVDDAVVWAAREGGGEGLELLMYQVLINLLR